MNTTVEVVGVHPIRARGPVHLIEILVRGSTGVFDVGEFTQPTAGQPRPNWQVPWDERILDSRGESIVSTRFGVEKQPELWLGNVRMVFFFHYLNPTLPLRTPFGDVALPEQTRRPRRLRSMRYEPPD